jgi:hypothetical protein
MVHFSVLSSKSSVLLFTCDTQLQWTSCWLHISHNTCQSTCCTFQSDMHFGLIVTHWLHWVDNDMSHSRRAEQAPCPNMLEPVTVSAHSGTERGGYKRWQSWTSGLSRVSPNEQWFPILLMVLASWNNALQDKRPAEHKQPAQLHYNIVCNTGTGTKDTWLLYVPKYEMRLLFYYSSFKPKRQGCQSLYIKH